MGKRRWINFVIEFPHRAEGSPSFPLAVEYQHVVEGCPQRLQNAIVAQFQIVGHRVENL